MQDVKNSSGRANDSLEAMRNDFINDFQKIMRESGETFFQEQHPNLNAQKDNQRVDYMSGEKSRKEPRDDGSPARGGALSQMLAAGQQMN